MEKATIVSTLNKAYFSEAADEEEILRRLPGLLTKCRSFVDLGASLGQFTKAANEVMTGGSIIAVEADPIRFQELTLNAQKWSKEGRNAIRTVNAAVAERSGSIAFQSTNSCVSGGLFRHNLRHLSEEVRAEVEWNEVSVDAVTLDELFPGPPPDFVKMDIEGAELLALQGACGILSRGTTDWFVELHDFEGKVPMSRAVPELMRKHRYGCIPLDIHLRCLFVRKPWTRFPFLSARGFLFGLLFRIKRLLKTILRS